MVLAASGMVSEKHDLLQALDFALDFFHLCLQEGRLTPEQRQVLGMYYKENRARVETGGPTTDDMKLRPRSQCWSCRAAVDPRAAEFCPACGAPLQGEEVQRLRYLSFLCFEIKKHEQAGRLTLSIAHDLMAEGNGRIAALRRKLEQERLPLVQIVAKPPPLPTLDALPVATAAPTLKRKKRLDNTDIPVLAVAPFAPRRSLLEILLDPRTIQWLLASGGALLVLGLVIWLAAEGLFENKLFVAVALGAANAALLVGGWSLIRLTRYQLAGRAITLLACLVMPLNLWFYDAQGLISLKDNGHLWIPALICCVLYAISARLLKDAMFVPVFVAGITLTGLLMLADRLVLKFWEISAPATLLVLIGLACIHVERLFLVYDGPFSRRRFGLAFFWSGQVVLAAGLGLLFAAQLMGGWLYPLFQPLYEAFELTQPEVVTTTFGKWLALVLVLLGTYAYLYSDLVVRRIGVYIYLAVFTLLWAEVLLIAIFAEALTIPAIEIVIVALALAGLLANLAIASLGKQQPTLLRAGPALALFLSGLPVLLGVLLQIQGTIARPELRYSLQWSYVVAMLITALCCRGGAYLYRRDYPAISATYFFGTAAATMAGAAGLLVVASAGTMPWHRQAPLLMIIPLLYLVASWLYRGHTAARPLGWVAHAATAVMLLASVGTAFKGFVMIAGDELNLSLAAFFTEAALFYALAAVIRVRSANVYFGTVAACAAIWQLLKYSNIPDEYYTFAFALTGLLLLVLYRFAVLEKRGGTLALAAFQCGNALLLLAFTAAFLITSSELLLHFDVILKGAGNSSPTWVGTGKMSHSVCFEDKQLLIPMLSLMVLSSVLAIVLVRQQAWRRVYIAAAVAQAALIVLVLVTLGTLTPGQKLEVAVLIVGTALLIVGHLGWYREQERHSDLVSMALLLGSLLIAVPFAIAVVSGRLSKTFDTFHLFNEAGMLICGLLLLGTGYACHLKGTTLAGAFMLVVYVASLVLFVRLPERLQSAAVYLMIGGGVFFGTGLLLSVYRDRLLSLPERIKRRDGLFRVLTWR